MGLLILGLEYEVLTESGQKTSSAIATSAELSRIVFLVIMTAQDLQRVVAHHDFESYRFISIFTRASSIVIT